jgi:CubicO group peptidase (beta-lactamase class C family)
MGTERRHPPATQLRIASLSKSFTAAAILQLVEEGKVELDAPVQGVHDLRGAQDQMNQMHRLLAQAAGQEAPQPGPGAASTPAWAPPVDISERGHEPGTALNHRPDPAGAGTAARLGDATHPSRNADPHLATRSTSAP